MKKCPFCARVLEYSDAFCPGCGNNVSGTAVSDPVTESKGKKGSKKPLIIIIAILAVLLAGIIGVVVLDVTGVIDISSVFSDEEGDGKTEEATEAENENKEQSDTDSNETTLENEEEHSDKTPSDNSDNPVKDSVSSEVNTVAIMATYVVTNDMSEDQAYAITKALWETQAVKTSHAKGAQMDIRTTLNGLGEVPLHSGAAKYYIEQGIIREEDVKIATAGTTTIEKIKVGTGGQTGTYYAFANASLNAITGNGLAFEIISSGGSAANINGINDGTYHMATVQGDVMNYAYAGTNGFETKITSFSAIACIYPEVCQLVVTAESGIRSVEDLKGKTVSVGDSGSGVYYNAVQLLEVTGLTVDDIYPMYASFGDSATGLKDGSIQAAFITAGAPTTAVTSLATSTKVAVIGFSEDDIESLIRNYPFYTRYTLTEKDYDFIKTN